jgi:hypothetical protein
MALYEGEGEKEGGGRKNSTQPSQYSTGKGVGLGWLADWLN